jgi:3-oxoacyl-[acyl-carrier protein] reductase
MEKSADKAKAVVAEIEAKGGKALRMQADMSQVADARRLVRDAVQRLRRLDILVNNAAISLNKALVETTEQEFDGRGSPPCPRLSAVCSWTRCGGPSYSMN